MKTVMKDHREYLWRVRLLSALRTVLACTIVGLTTLYGPQRLRKIPTYPAFAYVTTILIVSDSTVGETLRGCCHALLASIQVMLPSILCLWLIGPGRFTAGLGTTVAAVFTFMVAVPESTHILAKRIAFGQIVIVFVGAVIHGAQTGVVMHPVHVAASTALGCVASLLAVLLPYPRLAYYEVKKACRLYAENASERLSLFVKAFSAHDNTAAEEFITEAKFLNRTGDKLLQRIKNKQEGMLWERPQMRFQKPNRLDLGKKLQDTEIPIRGMELALTSCPSFPVGITDEELKNNLQELKSQIDLKLEQGKCYASFDATTAPETRKECVDRSLWTLKPVASTEDMPASFFFYSMQLLQNGLPNAVERDSKNADQEKSENSQIQENWILKLFPSNESLVFALKCSLSLSLAMLFGLIYNRESGYWSGLTIAICFTNKRQATFAVANARAQGTAMGSIYGILCCFIFQRFQNFRFLPMLPWIVFTSYLRHSKMYGEAGGISAAIGSLLILGRKNYGNPTEFAIARMTEATIGLLCFIIVEILFQPTRAASLTKGQLARTMGAIRDVVEDMIISTEQKAITAMREKQKKMKICIEKFEGFVAEAELEPNFWFLPFNGTCYGKILKTLSRMTDFLLFSGYNVEFLSQVSERLGDDWKEMEEQINDDLELFRERVGYALKCLEEVILIKSLTGFSQEQQKDVVNDVELGRPSPNKDAIKSLGPDEEEVEETLISFLQLSNEVAAAIDANEGEEKEKLKNQVILCLNGLGFCISSMMRETMVMEKEIRELIKWENPNRDINLHEISCKLNDVCKK